MESGVRKVVVEEVREGESTESVVLQEVEVGEEVARGELLEDGEVCGSAVQRCTKKAKMVKSLAKESGSECEEAGDVVSGSEDVVSVRCLVRSLCGRKSVVPWLSNFQNETDAYWRTGVRTGRCRAPESGYMDSETFVVDRTLIKRKHEEVYECSPVNSEAELYEDADSGDDSASSSESDASDSESEQWKRWATSMKRRRGGEDMNGSVPWIDGSWQLRSGIRKQPKQGTVDCDDELKEMLELLELQLQAAEKREAGMKQRMEMMMDLMSRHMGHVEKRVCNLEVGAQPQEQILERINVKLEKVVEGFSTLNKNLSILSACLSRNLDSQ